MGLRRRNVKDTLELKQDILFQSQLKNVKKYEANMNNPFKKLSVEKERPFNVLLS